MTAQNPIIAFHPHPKGKFINLTGRVFHRLTVLGYAGRVTYRSTRASLWFCKCECGNVVKVEAGHLCKSHTRSCGCLFREIMETGPSYKHGRAATPLFNIWTNMKGRCYSPNNSCYSRYGGRGIRVCDRWRESFTNFLADMGERPSPKHTLERINNEGNYDPANCRWATVTEQNNNRRSNRLLVFNGKTQSLSLWCAELGLNYRTVQDRLVRGWNVEKALTFPVRSISPRRPAQSGICEEFL